MKKALSLLLAILMIAINVVPAVASETDEMYEISSVSNSKLFADTFGITVEEYSLSNIANNGVVYDYNVIFEKNGTYSASMEFDVVINGKAHHAAVLGTLDAIKLDNGNIYLSRPLDGSINIEDNKYKIIVGFQTEYESTCR